MKRRHSMPFGAECLDGGSVRFRLWAPAVQKVDLCLVDGANTRYFPLQAAGGGWFEWTTDIAYPGAQYRFRIDCSQEVPDPASRYQPRDVHGPSEVIDPYAFDWQDDAWRGRRWEDAVLYELHVGTFTPAGTFSAASERLDYLADLGVTALELMPVGDFPGQRNWGYDGVFPYAPDSVYGRPEHLKALVQAAHDRGMMMLLDVVYNHFGPEGNYLRLYAPQFFTDRHHTPWGDGINFDGDQSALVREFLVHNALYWLEEYHFDGLRLDAVHAILDDSKPDILAELTSTVRDALGVERPIHLVLENDFNQASYLARSEDCQPQKYTAQWNDDIHHALHVLVTGEKDGYYADYSERPLEQLGRCLTEGFAYQGEASAYRNGEARGEPSAGLPPGAFVSFLQNHDQIGNRAFGERITKVADRRAVRAAVAIVLLAPSPPLLFMGEEFGAETPFLFFCDFEKGLAEAVTLGRRNGFERFAQFASPAERERIPDPGDGKTFEQSRLQWSGLSQARHRDWLKFYSHLIKLRCQHIVPHLSAGCTVQTGYETHGELGLAAHWKFADGAELTLLANLGSERISAIPTPTSTMIFATEEVSRSALNQGTLAPWSVVWCLEP